MEIGRQRLSDEDFINLWKIIHQEIISLATTNNCDLALFYNSVYIICTSNCNFEEKLYWKIGDCLYNRCKIHKNAIKDSPRYLDEYKKQFDLFSQFIFTLNKVCAFLNESTDARSVDDLGFLLWERLIIQALGNDFFDDIYKNEKIELVASLSLIKLDKNNSLLYYKEKYERLSIEKLIRHNKIKAKGIREFLDESYSKGVVEKRKIRLKFMEISYEKALQGLEEAFYGDLYYKILFSLTEIMHQRSMIDDSFQDGNEINTRMKRYIEEQVCNGSLAHAAVAMEQDSHEQMNDNTLFGDIHKKMNVTRAGGVVLKKAYSLYLDSYLQNNKELEGDTNTIYELIVYLKIFDTEDYNEVLYFIFRYYLQKAKPCYMTRLCKFTSTLFDGYRALSDEVRESVFDYFEYIESLDEDSVALLNQSLTNEDSLNHSLTNEDSNSNSLILDNQTKKDSNKDNILYKNFEEDKSPEESNNQYALNAIYNQKPFSGIPSWNQYSMTPKPIHDNIMHLLLRFKILVKLISEKVEFLNIYQIFLKERLLKRSSDLNLEMLLLSIINIKEHKLKKMVEEANCSDGHTLMINKQNWGMDPENHEIPLPYSLACRINISKGSDNCSLKWAHQYSIINILYNKFPLRVNIFQYSIIEYLLSGPNTIGYLSTSTCIPSDTLNVSISSLISNNILIKKNEHFYLNADFNGPSLDISKIKKQSTDNNEYCLKSLIESKISKYLKRSKRVKEVELINAVAAESGLAREAISNGVKTLEDKGFLEISNGVLEYID